MTGLESTKNARAECGALVWSPSGANARSANSSNPKVHRIDPGTLRGGVFGGFGVKHERTTDLSLLCSWVPDRSYANFGEHVFHALG
jgi:hypothetical protein